MMANRDVTATVSRTGGAYNLTKAFALLDISPSFGHALIKAGKIRVIYLGPGSPRITDDEIERLLRDGIPMDKTAILQLKSGQRAK